MPLFLRLDIERCAFRIAFRRSLCTSFPLFTSRLATTHKRSHESTPFLQPQTTRVHQLKQVRFTESEKNLELQRKRKPPLNNPKTPEFECGRPACTELTQCVYQFKQVRLTEYEKELRSSAQKKASTESQTPTFECGRLGRTEQTKREKNPSGEVQLRE